MVLHLSLMSIRSILRHEDFIIFNSYIKSVFRYLSFSGWIFNYTDVYDLQFATNASISPDGSTIIYNRVQYDIMTDKRYSNLWSIATDGSNHTPITSGKIIIVRLFGHRMVNKLLIRQMRKGNHRFSLDGWIQGSNFYYKSDICSRQSKMVAGWKYVIIFQTNR